MKLLKGKRSEPVRAPGRIRPPGGRRRAVRSGFGRPDRAPGAPGREHFGRDRSASMGGGGDWRWRGNRSGPSRARPALTPPRVPLPSMEENRGGALGWISAARGAHAGGTACCASRLGPPDAARLTRRLGMLTKWLPSTRLETRTKESNTCASKWAANPHAQ